MSVQLYAIVSPAGNVLNLIDWDGVSPYNAAPNTLVLAVGQPNAQIGGTYLNGVFTAPAAPPTPQGIIFLNSPATGANIQLPAAVALGGVGYAKLYVILEPAGALAALTLTAPINPADGDDYYILSTKAVTAFTWALNPGQLLVNAPTALAAGVSQRLTYSAQYNTFFKL